MASPVFEGAADPSTGDPATPLLLRRYADLAGGGCGLVVVSHAAVHHTGVSNPGMVRIDSDGVIVGHRRLVQAARAADPTGEVKFAIQLNHVGLFAHMAAPEQVVAPSAEFGLLPIVRELDPTSPIAREGIADLPAERIWEVQSWYADAASRAKAAGYDAVMLHLAHGYLLAQFLSPSFNRRQDAYGQDRARFVVETAAAVRAVVGPDFPILVKMNAADNVPEGTDPELAADALRRLVAEAGVCFAEISSGTGLSLPALQPIRVRKDIPAGPCYNLPDAVAVRERLAGVDGLHFAVVGGIRTLADVDAVLAAGIDVASFGRPLVRQPDLPRRLLAGEAATCVSCLGCLAQSRKDGSRFGCVVQRALDERAARQIEDAQ
eukprot:gnl/Ergobibamus_cyprinoides/5.p1 GENE.gnl/Ergobibamus_cyprinoides/5~~gnl/Ergobibamus_cyprinoides/5.p1  ORF type:complete len:404 (+),score=135.20 gnl/Ergobibamus_cyprinoides/5:81-1214(+)